MRILSALVVCLLIISACGKNSSELNNSINDIKVNRDSYNQTSIQIRTAPEGQADKKLFEAQGYYQAYDRFRSMDISRRQAYGELAELFGPEALKKDQLVISVGMRMGIDRKLEKIQKEFPEAYQALVAYATGVNKCLGELEWKRPDVLRWYREKTHNKTYKPRPWSPIDSVAVGQGVTFYLSSNLEEKLKFGALAAVEMRQKAKAFKTPNLQSLLDLRPLWNVFILDSDPKQNPWRSHVTKLSKEVKEVEPTSAAPEASTVPKNDTKISPVFFSTCENVGFPFRNCDNAASVGSNNWVANSQVTGGDTILANDPHLLLTYPMLMYESALDSKKAGGTFKMRGFGVPGIPGVLIGHNTDIAWGFTNLAADVDELYLEFYDPVKNTVRFNQKDVAVETKVYDLPVRQADGSLVVTKMSLKIVPHHGPVFSDFQQETLKQSLAELEGAFKSNFVARAFTGIKPNEKLILSYRWTGHESSAEFASLYELNRAKDFTSFKSALKNFRSGAQNIIYGDTKGNIGYFANGSYPVRKFAKNQSPLYPVWGNGVNEWEKEFRKEVPELYNPASGRVITANNDPYGHSEKKDFSDYEDYFGYGFSSGSRAKRITDLIEGSRGRADLATMKLVQTDHQDESYLKFVSILRDNKVRVGAKLSDADKKRMETLLAWNGQMLKDSYEASLAQDWVKSLFFSSMKVMGFGDDQFVEVAKQLWPSSYMMRHMHNRLVDALKSNNVVIQNAGWDALVNSFKVLVDVQAEQKTQNARWGERNKLEFANSLEGIIKLDFEPPQIERNGSGETVDVSWTSIGPAFRMLLSIKPNGTISGEVAVPGGNFPASNAKYTEELRRWVDGNYRSMVSFVE